MRACVRACWGLAGFAHFDKLLVGADGSYIYIYIYIGGYANRIDLYTDILCLFMEPFSTPLCVHIYMGAHRYAQGVMAVHVQSRETDGFENDVPERESEARLRTE